METRKQNLAPSLNKPLFQLKLKQITSYLPPWLKKLLAIMTTAERVTISLLLLLLASSGTLSVINYINSHSMLIPQAGGIYREAAVGNPRYLNPIVAAANDLDVDITRLVYSGLFRFNSELELQNDLADSVEISNDQTIYTIKLRQDVTWHDGKPFTADDVVFTIRSIQTPDYGSPLATSFQGVSVEKIDDYTVTFTLKQPYAPFLTTLTVGIVPEHVWAKIEPQHATLTEQILKPVGTGPFKFAEISTRRKTGDITTYRLERNENYYKKPAYLDAIGFIFYPTYSEALQAYIAGKADGLSFLSLESLDQIANRHSFNVHQLLLPQYFAVFFNQQKNDALREAGVRSALALGTDRQQIVTEALHSQGRVLQQAIPPGPITHEEDFAIPEFNLEAAKQNLSESGWEEDADGIRQKDGKKLSIKLTTTDWPEYIKTAEIIKEQWRKLGVNVTLEHLSAGTIQQTIIQPRDYEALLFGEILPGDPDPYPFWHSTQTRSPGLNLSLFKNQEVDKLLEVGRKVADPEKRRETYREFQNKLLELNPAIILYQPYYLFSSRGVYGIESNQAALPAGRFNNIENWHVNTQRVWKK